MITQDELKAQLEYNPYTGVFTWLSPFAGRRSGNQVGSTRGTGYVSISIGGKSYTAHRLAWLYIHGSFPADQIDHINHIKNDNRIINLRAVTMAENHKNKKLNSKNTSSFTGVSWDRAQQQWKVQMMADGVYK